MSKTVVPLKQFGFGRTSRSDAWWITPLLTFAALSTFVVYSTWAALQGEHYTAGPYLSPFYSPELLGDSGHSWSGGEPCVDRRESPLMAADDEREHGRAREPRMDNPTSAAILRPRRHRSRRESGS